MKRISVIKSLDLWDFNQHPEFIGMYVETDTIKPDDPSKEAFEQHVFIEAETGEEIYIPDNYSITKAIKVLKDTKQLKADTILEIIFKGKTEVGGKPFARFNVNILIDEDKPETKKSK